MKLKNRILSFFSLISVAQAAAFGADQRPFTVRDSVEMAYFGTLSSSSLTRSSDDSIVSPNGRFAITTTHRGVLPEGVTEGTMWLLGVNDLTRSIEDEVPVKPVALARMSAAINGYSNDFSNQGNTLLYPKWSDDGESVFFLGRDGHENRRLYKVTIENRKRTVLSPENRDVFAYSATDDHVAFLAGRSIDSQEVWQTAGAGNDDIVTGSGTALMPLMFPTFLSMPTSNL